MNRRSSWEKGRKLGKRRRWPRVHLNRTIHIGWFRAQLPHSWRSSLAIMFFIASLVTALAPICSFGTSFSYVHRIGPGHEGSYASWRYYHSLSNYTNTNPFAFFPPVIAGVAVPPHSRFAPLLLLAPVIACPGIIWGALRFRVEHRKGTLKSDPIVLMPPTAMVVLSTVSLGMAQLVGSTLTDQEAHIDPLDPNSSMQSVYQLAQNRQSEWGYATWSLAWSCPLACAWLACIYFETVQRSDLKTVTPNEKAD